MDFSLYNLKKLATILLLISTFAALSQKGIPKGGTVPNSTQNSTKKKYGNATVNSGLDTLLHTSCIEKQFSVVFYVVLDSTHKNMPNYPSVGQATPSNIDTMLKYMNKAFKPICISFVSCSTVYIPNYNYGRTWTKNDTEEFVTATYYTDKTINFFLVDSLNQSGTNESEGYTYSPTPANLLAPRKDLIVLEKQRILQMNGGAANHLLGHYFGLPHTFDEINPATPANPLPPATVLSHEFSDGSNCYLHGDGFCDTEADPSTLTFLKDGKGMYYVHPIDNFMSYYAARCRFTNEQFNAMTNTIITKRLYLH